MSTTELDEVLKLLERILPDPAGYGERLLQQVVEQWAGPGVRRHPVVPGETDPSGRMQFYGQRSAHPQDTVDSDAGFPDVSARLASALGACDCWGLTSGCPTCAGSGSSGWAEPEPELFHEYVGPAAARLMVIFEDPAGDEEHPRSDHHERPREGVNA